jgi:hypothetical protein
LIQYSMQQAWARSLNGDKNIIQSSTRPQFL